MYTKRFRTYMLAREEYYKYVQAAMNWITTMILTMLVTTLSLLFTIVYVIAINSIPLVITKHGGF